LCKVAAFNVTPLDTYKYPKEVEWEIDQNSKKEHLKLAKELNEDVTISGVIIQHEYGIFGGEEGENILYFMEKCKKPMVVTLHTVLPFPSPKMKKVTKEIIRLARTVVVLTKRSKEIVERIYPESDGKVFEIPHGIHPTTLSTQKEYKVKLELENHIILSTFGLLSPGKGIEYVLNALPAVVKKYPSVLYLILGETHPIIRRREGEQYRIGLSALVTKLKLQKHVKFYDQYLSLADLFAFLKATDVYISTSTNPNQAVSGTLSYALGTGRPVISTEFAQSKEIVTPEIGRLVPIKDSAALTSALFDLLSDRKKLKQMSRTAYEKTRRMLWSNVAEEYIDLLTRTVIPPFKIDHLSAMTDKLGLFQFASLAKPNKEFGYTLDDNVRALILCSWLIKQNHSKTISALIAVYFSFIKKCFQEDGSFINYIGFKDQSPTIQNTAEDLEDAEARTLWALSEVMSNGKLSLKMLPQSSNKFLPSVVKSMYRLCKKYIPNLLKKSWLAAVFKKSRQLVGKRLAPSLRRPPPNLAPFWSKLVSMQF
jgi:glycosyltransferase involved in cell wall biosynthesis